MLIYLQVILMEQAMNIYVIYKFSDAKRVNDLLNDGRHLDSEGILHFFKFRPEAKNIGWHKTAKKKMMQCNIVCYFCTITDEDDSKLRNISWELRLAAKLKKTVVVFTLNPEKRPQTDNTAASIYGLDFSGELVNVDRYKTMPAENAYEFLLKEAKWNVDQSIINLSQKINPNEAETADGRQKCEERNRLLLEQYKIMVDTSEKLMDRRQSTSNLYTTLCSALVALVGASFALDNLLIICVVSLLAGVIITCLCVNWKGCLKSYDMNNAGKFAVLNAIEKILPANMFDCEYRYNTKNGIRSYSSRERIMPIIFLVFGCIMICLGAGVGIYMLVQSGLS